MAGAGYKLFNTGDVLTAAQVNTYLQEQAVMRFANATARTTALSGVLAEGMVSYLDDTNAVQVYNGSAWVNVGEAGDITAVTAGTGISGGGTSGDVTITNSMATAIDAKGDLVAGTADNTFARLAVGSNDKVLVAASGETTGLKWDYKGWTLISTTSLSGATVSISSIPTGYQSLKLIIRSMTNATADGRFQLKPNNRSTSFLTGQENVTNYSIINAVFQTTANLLRTNADNIFVFDFDRYADSNNCHSMSAKYFYVQSGGDVGGMAGGMYYEGADISSFVLSNTGGNLNGGTAYLYGVS